MLTSLTVAGYRSFRHYAVNDIGRVNLLVGHNNCGKTSLLEAVDFVASKGHLATLLRPPNRRGEAGPLSDPNTDTHSWTPNIAHLFYRRNLGPSGGRITIDGSPGYRPISVVVRPLTAEERNGGRHLFEEEEDDVPLGVEIEGSYLYPNPVLPVARDGSILSRRRLSPEVTVARDRPVSTRFLAPRSLSAADMRSMWDRVQIEGRESEVLDAVRLVASDLDSLYFLVGDRGRSPGGLRIPSAAGILAGLRGEDRRVPLGSMGDGIRRLLALSLSLIDTMDGFLLADEIDSGLHWTVMPDLWEFIIRAARRYSVQVFATTHSLDCITGLADLYRRDPELTAEVSVFKMDRRLPRAVRLSADNVEAAVKNGIEIR